MQRAKHKNLIVSVEFDIARRLASRKHGGRAGIMERVATIATTISLMVIIITLSVVVGFKGEVGALMSSAASDIVITAPQSRGTLSEARIERVEALESMLAEDNDIERYSPYIAKEGVIKSDDNMAGIMLKGVDSSYDMSFFAESLVAGELPRIGATPRSKGLILSQRVAQALDLAVGERMEILFVDGDGGIIRDRFELSGIYSTGIDAIDKGVALTDMPNVAREYDGNSNLVTGYEIWLKEGAENSVVARRLNGALQGIFLESGVVAEAFAIEAVYPEIFGWLATHDVNALVVMIIMIIVALLNITTALLVIVLERQRMIGELRAMGMCRVSMLKLFLYRAMFIMCRGVVWGALLGILLVTIQHVWAPMPLPNEGYILTHVPAAMCWGWWAIAIVATVILSAIVMVIPALFATRSTPADALRYE